MEVRVLHEVCVVLVFIVNMFFVFAFVQTGNSKFMPRTVIETTAILSLDEEIKLNSDEVGFYKMVSKLFFLMDIIQLNLSTMATLGTEESGCCRQL